MKYRYLLLVFAVLFNLNTKADTYTTIASGTFGAASTWQGGNVPPGIITGYDTVIISAGHTVNLDRNFVTATPNAIVVVEGEIGPSAQFWYMSLNCDSFYCSGKINVDSFYLYPRKPIAKAGDIASARFHCKSVNAFDGAVRSGFILYIEDGFTINNGLTLHAGPTIHILGGNAAIAKTGTGAIATINSYDVTHQTVTGVATSRLAGLELTGSGLNNVTVDVGTIGSTGGNKKLLLGNDLEIAKGKLTLSSGTLDLNNRNLVFSNTGDLDILGSSDIFSTSTSNIEMKASNSITAPLRFAQGGTTVRDFIINFTNNTDAVKLGGNMRVSNDLNLQSGKIDVQTNKLSLITGASITGGGPFSYVIAVGDGLFSLDIGSGQSKTFPIGTDNYYAPAIVTSKNNTVFNDLQLSVLNGVRNFGKSGSYISATQPCVSTTWWLQNIPSNAEFDLEPFWNSNLEANNFDRTKAYISYLTGSYWDVVPPTAATNGGPNTFSVKRSGLKNYGFFAVFDVNTVSVETVAKQEEVKVYPNPANDVLYFKNVENGTKAYIYNTSGQLVLKQIISNNHINISTLPQGFYIIKNKQANKINNFTFIKN